MYHLAFYGDADEELGRPDCLVCQKRVVNAKPVMCLLCGEIVCASRWQEWHHSPVLSPGAASSVAPSVNAVPLLSFSTPDDTNATASGNPTLSAGSIEGLELRTSIRESKKSRPSINAEDSTVGSV